MLDAGCERTFDEVVNVTRATLATFGYKRSGSTFRKLAQDTCAIVQFQRSHFNAGASIKFAVNLSVVCGRLLEDWQPKLERAREMDGHLRNRLGFLMTPPHDKWWEIAPETEGAALASEVSELIAGLGVPYLDRHMTTSALVALWRAGKSPGLTTTQRDRYLSVLDP